MLIEVDKPTNTWQNFTSEQIGHISEVRGQYTERERFRRQGIRMKDRNAGKEDGNDTHSTYLAHCAGSDMAMKQQLVRIVHIIKRLNKVERVKKNRQMLLHSFQKIRK